VHPTLGAMKTLLRAIIFLAMLFAVLYVGAYNTHNIEFSCPIIQKESFKMMAAFLYFAVFAVGVVAGLALGSGGKKAKAAPEAKKKA